MQAYSATGDERRRIAPSAERAGGTGRSAHASATCASVIPSTWLGPWRGSSAPAAHAEEPERIRLGPAADDAVQAASPQSACRPGSFVGGEAEIARLAERLASVRLLTLVDLPALLSTAKAERVAGGYRMLETWDTLGLRATGSDDTILEGAFVPVRLLRPGPTRG
jgi:hypothetical protein